ncbi:MAG: tetratricopeptide repeat protein, partial [Phycisphaerae bacterium]|nr:tetratricopeptide repeat protein [Phycisphaerae bacterium]
MSHIKILILLAGILSLTNPAAFSQGAGIEWDTLNKEVMRLFQAGDYKRATVIAEKALKVAEENVGPDHPSVATSLGNLAELYRAQGEYAKAEPLYKRDLAISEKALGPDHPDV